MTAGLLELGEIMVVGAHRRLENTSHNIANRTTPGFKSGGVSFDGALGAAETSHRASVTDFSAGAMRVTGQPLDLAIAGAGFFRMRGADGLYYTRAGQFARDGEGRLVDAQGLILQSADGRDLIVGAASIEIADDGTIIENGAPVARVGLFEVAPDAAMARMGGAYFTADAAAMVDAAAPLIRQGMLEGSNVDLPGEMLATMAALREAEAGARIVQVYDSLIGQTISTLGRVQS